LNRHPNVTIAATFRSIASRARSALLATASLALLVLASPGLAQNVPPQTVPPQPVPGQALPPQSVPVPRPAPRARNEQRYGVQLSASDAQRGPVTTTAAPAPPPEPVIPDPRRNIPTNIFSTFDATQKAQAAKVSAYLSSLQTLVGNFVQVGPDGSKTKGDFYIQKPGKLRFEYDPPSPIDIISDGTTLVVRDRNLATKDVYPLSQTPLRYLLSDRIDLLKDTNVISITSDDLYISITIEEKQVLIGTSRLMLMVGVKDGQLKQWTVTDPQGYDTTVAIYNLDATKKLDPALFKIDMTNYSVPN
jgi:outer membrane lipoprotein-sorting protein